MRLTDPQEVPVGVDLKKELEDRLVQRVANFSRRLVRRGMPYGPAFDPTNAATRDRPGNFIGASLGSVRFSNGSGNPKQRDGWSATSAAWRHASISSMAKPT